MLSNKRHYDRLKEKGIVIESIFLKSSDNKELIRASDGLRNDAIYGLPLFQKRYFYNDNCIYVEEELDNYSVYVYEEMSKNQNLECPNCGFKNNLFYFYDGCPFCGTNFNIDYKNKEHKLSGFIKSKYKNFTPKLLIFMILFFFIILITIYHIQIKYWLLFLILSYFPAFILWFIISIFLDQIKVEDIKISPNLKENYNKIISNLNFELTNYYYNEKKYNNLIDFTIFKYYSIININNEKNNLIKIEYDISLIYFINNKIVKENKHQKAIMRKNNYKMEKKACDIKICKNCGADLNLLNRECEYCRTPIPKINDWLLEKIID